MKYAIVCCFPSTISSYVVFPPPGEEEPQLNLKELEFQLPATRERERAEPSRLPGVSLGQLEVRL